MSNPQSTTMEIYQERYSIRLGKRKIVISTRMVLITIAIVALTLRLFSAVYQGNEVSPLPGIHDQISYDGLARRVVDGYGFSFAEGHWPATRAGEPTAHWSYLYTLYLAGIYKVFGTNPLIARLIQVFIAAILQTFLVWRIGNRLFGRTAGLLAAALNAVYIYFFYYAGALITETFYTTCILWSFDAAFRLVDTSRNALASGREIRLSQWLELGLAAGLTVLLRQVFLLFLPFLFLWIWWNVRERQAGETARKDTWKRVIRWSAIKGLSVVVLVLALLIAPWTIRNYRAFGTFVLLNTNAGFAFFWGNHPYYGTTFIPLLPHQTYIDLIPKELRGLSEAELDKALLERGIQFITDDPVRIVLLSISRTREFFKFWPSPDSSLISNISRVGSFGISLPFMLYGLWSAFVSVWKSKNTHWRWDVALPVLFILINTAIHLSSWALIRYRLPMDVFLLIFAAFGIEKLLTRYLPSFNLK